MNSSERIEVLKDNLPPGFWDDGAYDFANLSIYLKGTASISKLKIEKEGASCFVTLVHEYVHFIQNFTTLQGFVTFITYIDLFAAFASKNGLLPNDPVIPTKGGVIDIQFGARTYNNFIDATSIGIKRNFFNEVTFGSTALEDFELITSTISDPYRAKEIFIAYVAYKGKQIPLIPVVARECMAIVSSYFSSGLSVEESSQTIQVNWKPQYHILYSFVSFSLPGKNAFKLAYLVAEMSLLILPCNETLFNILSFIKQNRNELKILSEDEIIMKIKDKIKFDVEFRKKILKAKQMLNQRIESYTKLEKEIEFFGFVKQVISLFKNGFDERERKNFTYRDKFDSSFLNYYTKIIKSPILIFPDNRKTMLGKVDKQYINTIANFSGVLTIFHKTYHGNLTSCPFSEKFSLCATRKGAECYKSPFAVFGKKRYKGCLLSNALGITGLKREGRV